MERKRTTTETSYQLLFKDVRTSSTVYHHFLDALADAREYKDIAGLVETTCVFYENGTSAKKGEVYLLHGELVKTDELKAKVKELGVKFKLLSEYAITETSYQLLFKDARRRSTIYHRFLDALADAREYKDIAGLVETTCVFYENGTSAKKGEAYLLHGELVKTDELKAKVKELGVEFKLLGGTLQLSECAILAPCGLAVAYGEHGRLLREYYIPDSRK